MNLRQIRKLADEWIDVLKLKDFTIDISVASMDTIMQEAEQASFGYCISSTEHLAAEIVILHPKEPHWSVESNLAFCGHDSVEKRVEATLLHELLHILFAHGRMPENIIAEEMSVNKLMMALMNLKYKINKPKRKAKNANNAK